MSPSANAPQGALKTFIVTCRGGLEFQVEARDLAEARNLAYDYATVHKFGIPRSIKQKDSK